MKKEFSYTNSRLVQLAIAITIPILFAALLLTIQSAIANSDDNYRSWLDDDYNWDEFYEDEIGSESVKEVCDVPEDYKKHKEACDKANYKIEKEYEAAREAFSHSIDKSPLPPTKEYKENVIDKLTEEQKEQKKETIEEYKKEVCKKVGAEWKDGVCDTKDDDTKAASFLAETKDIRDDISGESSNGTMAIRGNVSGESSEFEFTPP